jgi:hypothetical protein
LSNGFYYEHNHEEHEAKQDKANGNRDHCKKDRRSGDQNPSIEWFFVFFLFFVYFVLRGFKIIIEKG